MANLLSTWVSGTLTSTGRIITTYNTDRYQFNLSRASGSDWWFTNDSDKLGLHINNVGDKFYFGTGGDFWSSANGWLSTALSNRAPKAYITDSYVEFTIEGDADTYYPVTIHNWNGAFSWQRYSIHRVYSDPAPWDPIGTGSHRGGLTFAFEWAGDIAWGGNDKSIRVIEFNETYTQMVAGLQLAHCEGVVVWLRGGGAYYRLHGPGGRSQSYSINMSTWTSCAGVQYSPMSYDSGRVNTQIYNRYPLRGIGDTIYAQSFVDINDEAYYLNPNGTSNLNQLTESTRARWNMSRIWYDRSSQSSNTGYWTGTNGWGTSQGTWANAWKGGFSGWDIWGANADHPQGSGDFHAQGIVSGIHYASPDGSSAYGWMMVGANGAVANRYWLRGKWDTTTSDWVEMITTGNITSSHFHDLARYSLRAPGNVDSMTSSNFRTQLFGSSSSGYNISTARWNSVPSGLSGMNMYGTMLAWSGSDTHGFIAADYSTANIQVGGGSGDNISWKATLIHSGNIGSQNVGSVQGYSAYSLIEGSRGTHSGSDFPNGTLVTTDINASEWAGASFIMEVSGKSYSSQSPFKLIMQGYLYADTIINVSAMSYGSYFPAPVKVMNLNGNLAFWWPRGSYWNSFEVHVRDAGGSGWNRVTGIDNSVDPEEATKKVSCTPIQVLHTNTSTINTTDVNATNFRVSNAVYFGGGNNYLNWTNNRIYSNVGIEAPIFYDANDTGFYLDPNGSSRISYVYTDQVYTYGWFRNYGTQGMYNQDYGTHFYSYGSQSWGITGSGSNIYLAFRSNHESTIRGYVHANTDNNIGFLSEDGNWVLRTWNRGVEAYGSMLAPIFYDSNDTTYYLDPGSTGTSLNVRGEIKNPSVWINDGDNYNSYNENIRLFNAPNGVSVIGFSASGTSGTPTTSILGFSDRLETRVGDNWEQRIYSGYVEARGSFRAPIFYDSNDTTYYADFASTGIAIQARGLIRTWGGNSGNGAGWDTAIEIGETSAGTVNGNFPTYITGYGVNIRKSSDGCFLGLVTYDGGSNYHSVIGWGDDSGEQLQFRFNNGVVATMDYAGNYTANSSLRAPIFYDSQDTSYYVDPNSASQFSSVYANNWFRPQGGTGLYFQTFGYGIYSADSGGSSYGNVATYSEGVNSWPGYAIKNYACFMARDIRRGIFIPTQDTWLIRWESSDNMAHVDFELQWGSDIRHKSNIKRLTNSLEKVKQLKGVSYNYKGNERTSIGFIAQEVEPVLPEVVSTDGDGFKSVGYANIVALLSEAIKEQQAMIDELRAEIEVLKSK